MQSKLGFRIDSAGNEWQWLADVHQAPGLESEGEANAWLIAAAPEMLETLKEVRKVIVGQYDIDENGGPNWAMRLTDIIDTAINKAKNAC
jgi:hypothetical protein